jgi:uncharacterized DUF497 family protein
MNVNFEWDNKKATSNLKKHGVSFEEAMSCFYDPLQIAFEDPDTIAKEQREILVAHSARGKVLLVVYTVRDQKIRIISARKVTKQEEKNYAEGI